MLLDILGLHYEVDSGHLSNTKAAFSWNRMFRLALKASALACNSRSSVSTSDPRMLTILQFMPAYLIWF
jgi:hypothetical protein